MFKPTEYTIKYDEEMDDFNVQIHNPRIADALHTVINENRIKGDELYINIFYNDKWFKHICQFELDDRFDKDENIESIRKAMDMYIIAAYAYLGVSVWNTDDSLVISYIRLKNKIHETEDPFIMCGSKIILNDQELESFVWKMLSALRSIEFSEGEVISEEDTSVRFMNFNEDRWGIRCDIHPKNRDGAFLKMNDAIYFEYINLVIGYLNQ